MNILKKGSGKNVFDFLEKYKEYPEKLHFTTRPLKKILNIIKYKTFSRINEYNPNATLTYYTFLIKNKMDKLNSLS